MKEDTEELTLSKLQAKDRPSIYALGLLATKALEMHGIVVFAVDVLNRVQLMPSTAVQLKNKPRIENEILDTLEPEIAIKIMLAQGDSEDAIMSYISYRETTVDAI